VASFSAVDRTAGLYDHSLPVEVIEARLERLMLPDCSVSEYYELDLVAGMATSRIRRPESTDVSQRLAWARVAVRCNDLILEWMPLEDPGFPDFYPHFIDPRSYWTLRYQEQRALARAAAIGSLGATLQPGDIRNAEELADWFFDVVENESLDDVRTATDRAFEEGDIDRIRQLRSIKRCLRIVKLMVGGDGQLPVAPPRDGVLYEWLNLESVLFP
jgi:hypothetical protein